MQPDVPYSTNLLRQWPVYFVWIALIIFFGWPTWPNPLVAEPLGQDDALHLVQVRDLLAGQNWFDLVQHRLQPPLGLDMHWSRLIDAPMAALSFAFGERAMLFLWPGLLIGAFLFAALYCTRRLSSDIETMPALLVSALCWVPLSYFAPARIDHHNVQLVLALVMAGAVARPLLSILSALIAASSAALMMAIGLETLPYVVVGLAIISTSWALGFSKSKYIAVFGICFASMTTLVWMLQTNIQSQLAVCDMLSAAYDLPIIIGGLGLGVVAYAGRDFGPALRFALLIIPGVAALSAFYWMNPICLAGPLGEISIELKVRWLNTIAETQPIGSILSSAPTLALERYGPPLFALGFGIFLYWKNPVHRYGLAVLLSLLASACAVSVVQLRGTLFAHAYTIAIFALAIDTARKHYLDNQKSPVAIGAMATAIVTCQSLFFVLAGTFVPNAGAKAGVQSTAPEATNITPLTEIDRECSGPDVRSFIAGLGDAFVAAPVFFGAQVLEMGNVSVIAGPYHRATGAIFDAIRLFEDGRDAEHEVLSRWKPDYLVLCLTSDDTADVIAKYPLSLTARLESGEAPSWLQPLPKTGQLAIYKVLPHK
jgi:hypothetical protein